MAKKRTPEELARIKARKEFVQSNPELDPAEARKRFFVQTRVRELQKSGADVTRERRAALRQKFLSGDVQRQGFYTPTDVAKFTGSGSTGGSTGSSTSGNTGGSTTKKVVPRNRGMLPTPVPSKGEIIKAPSPDAQKGWDAEYGVERSNSNWYERNVAKPLQRYGATNPVGVPGQAAKDLLFGARNLVNETLGSMAATFTNPAINTVAGLFGKKPNLREAGGVEAAITTAGTIIDIGTAGGSKPLTSALSKVAQKGSQSLLKKNAVGTATTLSNVARKSKAAIEAAEQARMFPRVSGLENLTQSGRGVAAPGAFPSKKYSRMKDVYYDLNSGVPADVVSAKKALLKPPGKPSSRLLVLPKKTNLSLSRVVLTAHQHSKTQQEQKLHDVKKLQLRKPQVGQPFLQKQANLLKLVNQKFKPLNRMLHRKPRAHLMLHCRNSFKRRLIKRSQQGCLRQQRKLLQKRKRQLKKLLQKRKPPQRKALSLLVKSKSSLGQIGLQLLLGKDLNIHHLHGK
jgi:hypothetical protein